MTPFQPFEMGPPPTPSPQPPTSATQPRRPSIIAMAPPAAAAKTPQPQTSPSENEMRLVPSPGPPSCNGGQMLMVNYNGQPRMMDSGGVRMPSHQGNEFQHMPSNGNMGPGWQNTVVLQPAYGHPRFQSSSGYNRCPLATHAVTAGTGGPTTVTSTQHYAKPPYRTASQQFQNMRPVAASNGVGHSQTMSSGHTYSMPSGNPHTMTSGHQQNMVIDTSSRNVLQVHPPYTMASRPPRGLVSVSSNNMATHGSSSNMMPGGHPQIMSIQRNALTGEHTRYPVTSEPTQTVSHGPRHVLSSGAPHIASPAPQRTTVVSRHPHSLAGHHQTGTSGPAHVTVYRSEHTMNMASGYPNATVPHSQAAMTSGSSNTMVSRPSYTTSGASHGRASTSRPSFRTSQYDSAPGGSVPYTDSVSRGSYNNGRMYGASAENNIPRRSRAELSPYTFDMDLSPERNFDSMLSSPLRKTPVGVVRKPGKRARLCWDATPRPDFFPPLPPSPPKRVATAKKAYTPTTEPLTQISTPPISRRLNNYAQDLSIRRHAHANLLTGITRKVPLDKFGYFCHLILTVANYPGYLEELEKEGIEYVLEPQPEPVILRQKKIAAPRKRKLAVSPRRVPLKINKLSPIKKVSQIKKTSPIQRSKPLIPRVRKPRQPRQKKVTPCKGKLIKVEPVQVQIVSKEEPSDIPPVLTPAVPFIEREMSPVPPPVRITSPVLVNGNGKPKKPRRASGQSDAASRKKKPRKTSSASKSKRRRATERKVAPVQYNEELQNDDMDNPDAFVKVKIKIEKPSTSVKPETSRTLSKVEKLKLPSDVKVEEMPGASVKTEPVPENPVNGFVKSPRKRRASAISANSNSNSPADEEVDYEDNDEVTCWCNEPFGGRAMIECECCLQWLHMKCIGIPEKNIPENFICSICLTTTGAKRRRRRSGLKARMRKAGQKPATKGKPGRKPAKPRTPSLDQQEPVVEPIRIAVLPEQDASENHVEENEEVMVNGDEPPKTNGKRKYSVVKSKAGAGRKRRKSSPFSHLKASLTGMSNGASSTDNGAKNPPLLVKIKAEPVAKKDPVVKVKAEPAEFLAREKPAPRRRPTINSASSGLYDNSLLPLALQIQSMNHYPA